MIDLLIIGAGPGGFEAALEAKKHHMEVALIDQGPLGGTCLNLGCIPSKMMHHRAALYQQQTKGSLQTSNDSFSLSNLWTDFHNIRTQTIHEMKHQLELLNIPLYEGHASLVHPHGVLVNGTLHEAKLILIATGSLPFRPTIKGINSSKVYDSSSLFTLERLPKHVTILGGGYIGVEWAGIFRNFGSQITLIEASSLLLSTMDQELVKRLTSYMRKSGIDIRLQTSVSLIEEHQSGLKITLSNESFLDTEVLLVATGRTPALLGLGLENLGVQTSSKGILVNSDYQTSIDSIYAIGDCIGGPLLAHRAKFQGKEVIAKIVQKPVQISWDSLPSVVFALHECASFGLTEEAALQNGTHFQTKKVIYRSNGKATTSEETEGFIKILLDGENYLLGAHIIGAHASDLIHELALIHALHVPLSSLKGVIHAHPTYSELIETLIQST